MWRIGLATSRLAVAIALIAAVPSATSAATVPQGQTVIDSQEDCLEPIPASTSVTGVTDEGQSVSLDVLALLDGVTAERGREIMSKAAEAYAPLKISLDVRYEEVAFEPEKIVTVRGEDVATSSSLRLLQDAKQWTMGARPADADVVYVITQKDISDAAGRADCIGGVRYAGSAFAVGENYRSENLGGIFYKNGSAKIAAHEVGHLLGAHHHYANCAEGVPGAVREVGPTPCTTMFNFIDFLSLGFGTLEAAVIRGHAVDFASGGPDEHAVYSRSVTLSVTDDLVARGEVHSTQTGCTARVAVEIQLSREDGWVPVATGKTRRAGRFHLKLTEPAAQLRAYVPESSFEREGRRFVCAQGSSPPVRSAS